MIRKFLHLFAYVRELEGKTKTNKNIMASMERHIEALEGVKKHLEEQNQAIQKDRDELYAHLDGRKP
jgi:tRNA U34 5-carboxymethylaminomethyl modifying GTPase MnmE/TrmE